MLWSGDIYYDSTQRKEGGVWLSRTGDIDQKPIFPAEKSRILEVPIAGIFKALYVLLAIFRTLNFSIIYTRGINNAIYVKIRNK